MPADLQSAPVGRLGNLPMCTPCVHDWLHYQPFFVFANRAIGVFRHSKRRSHTISWRVLNHMVGSRFKLNSDTNPTPKNFEGARKIGRASCREREKMYGIVRDVDRRGERKMNR